MKVKSKLYSKCRHRRTAFNVLLRLNNSFNRVLRWSKIKTRLALNNVNIRVFHDNFPKIIIYSVVQNLDTPLNKDDLDNVAVVDSYDVYINQEEDFHYSEGEQSNSNW